MAYNNGVIYYLCDQEGGGMGEGYSLIIINI